MTPLALIRTAWASIGANPLRTVLTLLGIIIGVAAVISLMSIGRGVQATIRSDIEALGTNLLYVHSAGGSLTLDDALALNDPVFAPSIVGVAPELSTGGSLAYRGSEAFTRVEGVTSEFASVRNFKVKYGEFISPAHVLNRSNVATLGARTAEDLFGNRDPVGVDVLISGIRFKVIGVLESKGANAFGNEDQRVLVPLTTAFYRLSGSRTLEGEIIVSTINVQAAPGRVAEAQQEATQLLRLRRKITDADDFTVENLESLIQALNEATGALTAFLGAVAGISLLVGGIGVMNIMLVSVTERTREIGIRKALGAKRRDILAQFVVEATALSLAGGALGVVLGVGGSRLLGQVSLAGEELPTVFSGDIAALALAISGAIGLFFGIYPAARAARLHPIEALRRE